MIQILEKEVSIYESGRVNNDSSWLNDELERGLFLFLVKICMYVWSSVISTQILIFSREWLDFDSICHASRYITPPFRTNILHRPFQTALCRRDGRRREGLNQACPSLNCAQKGGQFPCYSCLRNCCPRHFSDRENFEKFGKFEKFWLG
jgi:hypothetical protein